MHHTLLPRHHQNQALAFDPGLEPCENVLRMPASMYSVLAVSWVIEVDTSHSSAKSSEFRAARVRLLLALLIQGHAISVFPPL